LRFSVDLLLEGEHDLRVLHVPGEENEIADALSWHQFQRALDLRSPKSLDIIDFKPPHLLLGAAKK